METAFKNGQGGIQTNQYPDQGKFYLLAVQVDPLLRQKHIHARGDYFSTLYPLYLLLAGDLEEDFSNGEILAYWIFIVEETPDRFNRLGEDSEHLDRIDRDKVNQWLASLSGPEPLDSSDRACQERFVFSYLHLIPLSFN